MTVLDLTVPRRVHVVAAGGAGMSGIATILAEQGHRVTGSDLVDGVALARLRDLGIEVVVGHAPQLVGGADAVAVSTAVPADDPEIRRARELGVPVLNRGELLPSFAALQPFLSVSGTHGKTTTASMLAAMLRGSELDVSYLVGANVPVLGSAAGAGRGDWFVLEADESDGSFLAGPRAAAIVTNIEPDHLEFWGGWDQLRAAFAEFLRHTDGPRLVCADDPEARAVGRAEGATTYGCHADADHRIEDLELTSRGSTFRLRSRGHSVPVEVPVAGRHNALNAAATVALASELDLDVEAAVAALGRYTGVARRFEARGEAAGVHLVDDYAHLPTEVRAALAAARSGDWNRVVAVFQPHRYSRTEALWADFADAFDDADVLVLTEIHPAGEAPRPGVTGRLLVDAVRAASPSTEVVWAETLDDVVDHLASDLRDGDLCLTMGAGNITTVPDHVLARLSGRNGGPR